MLYYRHHPHPPREAEAEPSNEAGSLLQGAEITLVVPMAEVDMTMVAEVDQLMVAEVDMRAITLQVAEVDTIMVAEVDMRAITLQVAEDMGEAEVDQ